MANKKSKDQRPARKKYTTEQVWQKNKAKRIFKQMKKFVKYAFPENASNTIKVYVQKLVNKAKLDFKDRL